MSIREIRGASFACFAIYSVGLRPLREPPESYYRNFSANLYRQYQLPVLPIPITGTTNTTYRYYQYRLSVLPIPITGTTGTKKRKKIDTSFELFKALISYLFKTLKSLKNKA